MGDTDTGDSEINDSSAKGLKELGFVVGNIAGLQVVFILEGFDVGKWIKGVFDGKAEGGENSSALGRTLNVANG